MQAAIELDAGFVDGTHRPQGCHEAALHVECSPAVHAAVDNLALPGVVAPIGMVTFGDDVDVPIQNQRTATAVAPQGADDAETAGALDFPRKPGVLLECGKINIPHIDFETTIAHGMGDVALGIIFVGTKALIADELCQKFEHRITIDLVEDALLGGGNICHGLFLWGTCIICRCPVCIVEVGLLSRATGAGSSR